MKRLVGLLIVMAILIVGIICAVRYAQRRTSFGVAGLLPRSTVAFVHLPDFNGILEDWRRSDVYQIYREPAVQEFLRKPLEQSPKPGSLGATVQQIQQLKPTEAFFGLSSIANDQPKIIGGFQFGCSRAVADRILGEWKGKLDPSAKRDRIDYQKHTIEVVTQAPFTLATVQDQNWFFASNNLEELKALLDRADGRVKDANALLNADDAYREAIGAMPTSYAAMVYLQPKVFVERIKAARQSAANSASSQMAALDRIRSVSVATRFDGGKLHDTLFLAMPNQMPDAQLGRTALPIATASTILYAASLVDLTRQANTLFPAAASNPLGPAAQKISDALARAGVTAADWTAAFGSEFDMISEWPNQSRWPNLIVAGTVKDQNRARKIIDVLSSQPGEGKSWEQSDRDGVHYWALNSTGGWLVLRPVMALSDRFCIGGLDVTSVEEAVKRSRQAESGLAQAENYHKSAALLPNPTQFFAYVDPAQIYTRIDATVRPFLLMGAMFNAPGSNMVDLTKIPPPDAITKHLSPIVSSQYYSGKGYILESIGPLTINQAAIGLGVAGGFGAMAYHKLLPAGAAAPAGLVPLPKTSGLAKPAVTPSPTP
jgi:hypothetical protein